MSEFKLGDEVIILDQTFSKNISGIVEDGYPDSYLIKFEDKSEVFFLKEIRKMTKLDRALK